jgi:hypothetical protein
MILRNVTDLIWFMDLVKVRTWGIGMQHNLLGG